jgi:F0F1-type ATP synthase delta subunit
MEKKFLYKDLIALLSTDEEVFQLVDQLEAAEKDLYKNDATVESVLSSRVSSRFFSSLQEIFRQFGGDVSKKESMSKVFSAIISEIQHLPVIHLTLAFDPTPLLLHDISQWLRQNVAADCILDITIDRKIIGGFLMDYNGKYWDFSIRSSFERLFGGGNLIYLVKRTPDIR